MQQYGQPDFSQHDFSQFSNQPSFASYAQPSAAATHQFAGGQGFHYDQSFLAQLAQQQYGAQASFSQFPQQQHSFGQYGQGF